MEGSPENLNILRLIESIRKERQALAENREMIMALERRDAMIIDLEKLSVVQEAEIILRRR